MGHYLECPACDAAVSSPDPHYALTTGLHYQHHRCSGRNTDINARNPQWAAPERAPSLPSLQKLLSNADTLHVIGTRLVTVCGQIEQQILRMHADS